jgi:fluoroquinolone transport system permease protein
MMEQLKHLLKHDFILLYRNKIIVISLLVTTVYVLIFRALSAFGNIEKLLVLVIFNDPALLGFLFVGVMVLFEKNENTLEALAVTPIKISNYILSKSINLTLISLICCFAMVLSGYGSDFHYAHFFLATVLTTLIFSFIGFIVVAGQSNFNKYILKAMGLILLLTVPFLGYFEVTESFYYVLFPTYPAIGLYNLAFAEQISPMQLIFHYGLAVSWCLVTYKWAHVSITKSFQ